MANSKVLLSDLMYCRCFSTAEVRVRPGMSSDIKSFVKKIASEMEGGRERRSKRQRATGEQLIFGEQEQPVTIAEQTEKAFLKQPNVFLSLKKSGKGKRHDSPESIDGHYIDKKCSFTGTVSVRGHILAGTCHSVKMQRTIIVRRNYLHFVKKYQRYEKRHSSISAHVAPCFRVKEGDHVIIGQCRPLSKDCEVQCAEGDPSMHICLCQEGIHWNVIGFEVMESFYVSECFVC
uniref:Small ribosomal subunit protein uS17 N-terminal domain-containing protein n=1 Tax=Brassica oleracea var. oleracea TaxID=109376 RepID=A0A0D3CSI6_BRAOL